MEPITGTMLVTQQPNTVAPPVLPQSYFGVAQSLVPAAKILAAASPPPAIALAMVCAHTLECLLKAFLSKDGSDSEVRKKNVQHNIVALWAMAHAKGLHIPESPPSWVECLSRIHDSPYYLRYSTGVHGIVTPGAEPMASELVALLETVRVQIR
jgi:hypothetical protein